MREPRVRFPALLVGAALSALFCLLTPTNNIELQNSPLAGGHFPLVSFGVLLFLLLVANPLLSLLGENRRFHLHEVFLIWSMVTVATGIAYTGLFRAFVINITSPGWFGAVLPDVGKVFLGLAPDSLFPKDPGVIRALYNGLDGGREMGWWELLRNIPWQAWTAPLIGWALFILPVYAAMVGLMGIFTHQWIENEKMNFPLLRVPAILAAEAEKRSLSQYLTHRYFLIGVSIPVALHLLNGLHAYFPEAPQIPTLILAQPFVPKQGFLSGFYKFKIYIYPAFIGFAFLTSNQASFSLWFFYILGGLLPGVLEELGRHIPAAALGTTLGPVLAQVEEMQMIGAFGIFFFFILWLARHHLKSVLGALFRKEPPVAEARHGMISPRTSAYLFLGGFLGILAWMRLFGVDLPSAALFLGVCFMLQLVTARLVCQGGLPFFTLTAAPSDGFLSFLDTRLIAPATLFMSLVVQKMIFLDVRESLLPSLFHVSKLSNGSRPRGRFLLAVVWAVALALVVTFISMLALYYKFGISSLSDEWAVESTKRVYENAAQLLTHPEASKEWSIVFTLIGAVVMGVLVFGYHRFIWWPLHPIGYLTIYSSAMRTLWFCYFIGWLCSTLVLRYGGVNQYKEARRLFVGLVTGDMLMALVWLVIGLFSPVGYHVMPK
jgi:hypothetical protein